MSYSFERLNIEPLLEPNYTNSERDVEKFVIKTSGIDFAFDRVKKLFKDDTVHPSVSFNINILANVILKDIIFFFLDRKEYVISYAQEVFFFPLTMKCYFRKI